MFALSIGFILFFVVFWWLRWSEFHKQTVLANPKMKIAVNAGALIILAFYERALFFYVRSSLDGFMTSLVFIGCIGGFLLIGSWMFYDINKQRLVLKKRSPKIDDPI